MNSKDEKPATPTAKNGSSTIRIDGIPLDDVQPVSSEEYRQAINCLAEQIRQMAKPMAETQGTIKKMLTPMAEISEAMYEIAKSHAEQMRHFSIPLRELVFALSEQGWTSGNTTVKITADVAKENTVIIESATTTQNGKVEHQQSQTVKAELVGEDKDVLHSILRTVEKELSLEDVKKWLKKNGMKAVTIKVLSLVRQETNLIINGVEIAIEPFSRQDLFLKAFFNKETGKPDEEAEEFGISVKELYFAIDSPDDPSEPFDRKEDNDKFFKHERKKYQDLKDAINRKVQGVTGLEKFIVFLSEIKCWKINPKYLT
ncbi:MAG: hypothetical protein ACK5MU_00840 [Candidatus Saccharimonadales bacterium]